MSSIRTDESTLTHSRAALPNEARAASRWNDSGLIGCAIAGLLFLGFALSVDFPKAAYGFQSDEATYYTLAHSLARDFDFEFRRKDLVRVWEEFSTGPEGIFLKKGKKLQLQRKDTFPYFELLKLPDPRTDRLYFGKSYIYPLFAAPLVWLFGTNGFLVLHAVLMTLNLAAAYAFLARRTSQASAIAYALVFFFASAVPVYFVWLTPDFFNVSLVLYAFFLWIYKEAVPRPTSDEPVVRGFRAFLRSPSSDYAAALVLGVATFSKPIHVVLILPLLLHAALGRRWRHGITIGTIFGLVVAGLFALNVAITGELNYQGGERKTFYGRTEFPFQNKQASFETAGLGRGTDRVLVEVLFTRDAFLQVFRHNLVYFLLGRHSG
ncbi:MAG: hypothetical protein ACRD1T_16310, partial [Acidimicrobiia bacterium]